MNVSMDGLRLQLLSNYNALARKLNKGLSDDKTSTTVETYDIEGNMEVMRQCIVTLAYMYDNREDGFKELSNPFFEEFKNK